MLLHRDVGLGIDNGMISKVASHPQGKIIYYKCKWPNDVIPIVFRLVKAVSLRTTSGTCKLSFHRIFSAVSFFINNIRSSGFNGNLHN